MIGFIYLIVGVLLLYYGAEYLIKGGSSIALAAGVKKIVIGLTVVAFGTSLPEFVVSFFSALKKVDSVCVGNVIGSNIINILLVLGIASIIRPINSSRRVITLDIPFLLFLTLLFIFISRDGKLSRIDGVILFAIFLTYMIYILSRRKSENLADIDHNTKGNTLKYIIFTMGGLLGLIIGGNFTVRGAVKVAQLFGIPELFIGLTIVALGTSLPELFTSILAIIRKEQDISLGNIIGSNLFNIAFILGFIAIFNPIKVELSVIKFDNLFMLSITILLAIFLYTGGKISRFEGIIFVLIYFLYVSKLIVEVTG
ncbi:MAG: calcium/sodium antiporter [Candidatus Marinimicrobia bacterium]|nr:calcium/sodium antiporter [Candidatus Neomarinimicrobiota bacterium]